MSKYSQLTDFLAGQSTAHVPMTFEQIERVLGFSLPPSSRTHRAWWSNNPSNNVMTKAWLKAGYRTEDVDIPGHRLVFRRDRPRAKYETNQAPDYPYVEKVNHPAFGCMAGTVTFIEDVDLTEPADPDWADLIEEQND